MASRCANTSAKSYANFAVFIGCALHPDLYASSVYRRYRVENHVNPSSLTPEEIKIVSHASPMPNACLPNPSLDGGRSHISKPGRTAIAWERLSASKFPYRCRLLYGLLLELRSFYHRIRRLRKRGDILQPQMGPVWKKAPLGHLMPSERTRARILDTQQLLASQPWLSPEDWQLFLLGWDAGREYCACHTKEDRSDL